MISGLLFIVVVIIGICVVASWLYNPFSYPYCRIVIDISRRKSVRYRNEIEQYLVDNDIDGFTAHKYRVEQWKDFSLRKVEKSVFSRHRRRQYESVLADSQMFCFVFVRKQTRYRQKNYVKYSYIVECVDGVCRLSYSAVMDIYHDLEAIGLETTLAKYHAQNQRRLMTDKLREKIKRRDGYRCQICGKYMPDSVGLQIDHIIPVSKGGKTVESNLQVLCDVCNRRKSNKIVS